MEPGTKGGLGLPEYVTKQGDTFESIAWFQLGDSNQIVNLIRANRQYMETGSI